MLNSTSQSTEREAPPGIDPLVALPARPDANMPSLDRAADTIAAHVLADLIDQYLHAKHRLAVLWDRVGRFGELDLWCCVADELKDSLALQVVGAILKWHNAKANTRSFGDFLNVRWPDSGVVYRGRLYAAVAREDFAHHAVGETEGDHRIMGLSEADLPGWRASESDLDAVVNLDQFFNPPTGSGDFDHTFGDAHISKAAPPKEDIGLDAAFEASSQAAARNRRVPAWLVTNQDITLYHESNRKSLDQVIREELDSIHASAMPQEDDLAIWQGERLMAVIRSIGGKPSIARFDADYVNPEDDRG